MKTECPDCGSALRFTLDDVAKQRTLRCSRGHLVRMQDQDGSAKEASKAHNDLDNALKGFGK